MVRAAQLSPRQLARAVGVSESSIKRWADEGRIPLVRTAGGHRRIAVEEAIRFIRESRMDVVDPDALGLTDLEPVRAGSHANNLDRLRDLLLAGEAAEFRAALLAAFVGGTSLDVLADGPLAEAMEQVGTRWLEDDRGIFEEHRTTALAVTGLIQLGLWMSPRAGAPVAIGGAVRGDRSQLATLMASTVLTEAGYETVDLGADTPPVSFRDAIEAHHPQLVWLSINHVEDLPGTRQAIEEIYAATQASGASLVVGGRETAQVDPGERSGLMVARSMGELAAYGRGLLRGRGD